MLGRWTDIVQDGLTHILTNQMSNYIMVVTQGWKSMKMIHIWIFDMFFLGHEILPASHAWVPDGSLKKADSI